MTRTASVLPLITLLACGADAPALRLVASDEAYLLTERLSANFDPARAERISVSRTSAHHGLQRVCEGRADAVVIAGPAPRLTGCALAEVVLARDHSTVLANRAELRAMSPRALRRALTGAHRRFSELAPGLPESPIRIAVLGGPEELRRLGGALGVPTHALRRDGITFVSTLAARNALTARGPRLLIARHSFVVSSGLEGLALPAAATLGPTVETEVRVLRRAGDGRVTPWLRWVQREGRSELDSLGFESPRSPGLELRTAIAPR